LFRSPDTEERFYNRSKKLSKNKVSGNTVLIVGYMEIGIKKNHIYSYMIIPQKYAVSKIVETIKKNTSRSPSRNLLYRKRYIGTKGIFSL